MQDRRRVIFIAKDSSFEHKHVILNLAQIESLPGVKAHLDKMLAHATMIQLGGQKVHYLCRIIWWADNIGREVESPWSEAAFCWRYFAQWRDEMITAQQGNDYALLETDETGRHGVYNLFTDVIDAALGLENTLNEAGRDVAYTIVVDECRRNVPRAILNLL